MTLSTTPEHRHTHQGAPSHLVWVHVDDIRDVGGGGCGGWCLGEIPAVLVLPSSYSARSPLAAWVQGALQGFGVPGGAATRRCAVELSDSTAGAAASRVPVPVAKGTGLCDQALPGQLPAAAMATRCSPWETQCRLWAT